MLLLGEVPLQELVGLYLVQCLLEQGHHDILLAQQHVPQQAVERVLTALVLRQSDPLQPLSGVLQVLVPQHGRVLRQYCPSQLLLLLSQRLLNQQLERLFLVVAVQDPAQLLGTEALPLVHPQMARLTYEYAGKEVHAASIVLPEHAEIDYAGQHQRVILVQVGLCVIFQYELGQLLELSSSTAFCKIHQLRVSLSNLQFCVLILVEDSQEIG